MLTYHPDFTLRPEAALPVGAGGLLEPSAGSRVAEATIPGRVISVSSPVGADQ
jgi:hypothetical protein